MWEIISMEKQYSYLYNHNIFFFLNRTKKVKELRERFASPSSLFFSFIFTCVTIAKNAVAVSRLKRPLA